MQKLLLSPIFIFNLIWIAIIGLYSLKLSNWMPGIETGLMVALVSMATFNIIFAIPFLSIATKASLHFATYEQNKLELRKPVLIFWIIVSLLLISYSLYQGAIPSLIAKILYSEQNYKLTYDSSGSAVAIANAFLWTIFPLSIFIRSPIISNIFRIIPFAWFVLLLNRGCIMLSIIEYMFLKMLLTKKTTKHNKLSVSKIALTLSFILIALFAIGWIGDTRVGKDSFLIGFGIDKKYWWLPSPLIWSISYFSFPFANLISLVNNFNDYYLGQIFLSRILPSFLRAKIAPQGWIESYLPNEFNNVPTYLGIIYADFGWVGIVVFNLLLGYLAWSLFKNVFLKSNIILLPYYAFFITALSLIFFENFFLWTPSFYHLFIMLTLVKVSKDGNIVKDDT
jgi:oligosaccharide repeat unit polymerase